MGRDLHSAELFVKAIMRRGRRVKVPLLLQTHATECGAACLGSVLAYFGRWVPLTELRGRCEVSRDGSTAAGIVRAAKHYGLECIGRTVNLSLLRRMPVPLILFWEFNHFVVLEGFDSKRFFLLDPAAGRRTLSSEEFSKGFTGVALQFKHGSGFQPGGARSTVLQHIPFGFRSSSGAVVFAAACGLMLAVLTLVLPASLAIVVDRVLGGHEAWGLSIAGIILATAVLVFCITWLKQRCLQRLAVRISVVTSSQCVSRLLRLPIDFFNHRFAGDLAARIMSIDKIAKGLSDDLLLGAVIEAMMGAVFLSVLLVFEPTFALIVVGMTVLHGALAGVIARMQADSSHAFRREQGLLLGVGAQMLSRADDLRMTSTDDQFFARWGGHQARELTVRQRLSELRCVNDALPGLFTAFGQAAVLTIGVRQVLAGEMALGVLVGLYFVAAMMPPVGRFVELANDHQVGRASLERLEDIMGTPEDPTLQARRSGAIPTLDGRLRLVGDVEMRRITFGYNPGRPPLLKDFSLTIRPGQRVAVVGPSGSGKSTLSRLVAGIYQPWSGDILFDGRPRNEIPDEVLSRSLAMVDQHVVLFSGTVRDNITLWSPAVPDHVVVAAAKDACIHDEVLNRPLGYAAEVEEGGRNFSGGQRQRLEIARALAGNPTVLVLDEATSDLDAATEEYVDDALRRRGMSCLIVAHRLSTIRDCDEIIVLDKGREVQRGTHDELMADSNGPYSRLLLAG